MHPFAKLSSKRQRVAGVPDPTSAPDVVSQVWDRQVSEDFERDFNRRAWTGVARIHNNYNFVTTGDKDYYWVSYLKDRFFVDGRAGDTLALGCGEGHVDRTLFDCGFRFTSFTGVDLSPMAVERAQTLADEKGISPNTRYVVADLNEYDPPESSFDFIYFFQSLHHVEALEQLLSRCARALRPSGIMMICDFFGPSRFQWTDQQVEMAARLLCLLPEPLSLDVTSPQPRRKTDVVKPTISEMIAGDPSEAVRSAEMEFVMKLYFDVVEEANWGGTLNHLVLENIAGNFDPQNPHHNTIIDLLICHENDLIKHGVLTSDYKLFMLRAKERTCYDIDNRETAHTTVGAPHPGAGTTRTDQRVLLQRPRF